MKPNPKAVPGCPHCPKSVSGVCIRHAGSDVENHPRRCIGLNLDGSRCSKWGVKGTEPARCRTHDEDEEAAAEHKAEGGRARSDTRRQHKATNDALKMLGKDYETIDSLEKLEALSAEALDFMAYLREQLKSAVANKSDTIDKDLARYVSALDRCGKLLETFSKQGLQEREVRMREELVGLVTGLFNTVLASYIPIELQPQAQAALATAVATLAPQRQLEAAS